MVTCITSHHHSYRLLDFYFYIYVVVQFFDHALYRVKNEKVKGSENGSNSKDWFMFMFLVGSKSYSDNKC